MTKPSLLSTEIAHQNPWYHIRHDTVQYSHRVGHQYVAVTNPAAFVIAIQDGNILLVEQYRYVMNDLSIEFPGGGLHGEESLGDAAQRELQEETGYRAGELTELGSFFSLNGYANNQVHFFVAHDLQKLTEPALDEEEHELRAFWLPVTEFEEKIRNGEIKDGETLAAWTLFRYHQEKNPS